MNLHYLNGNWTYRSFINNPVEVGGDAQKALALIEIIAGTAAAIYVQQFIQYFHRPPVMGTIPAAGDCPVKRPGG